MPSTSAYDTSPAYSLPLRTATIRLAQELKKTRIVSIV